MRITPVRARQFRSLVYRYYRAHGRSFPWRETHHPYKILVSEIMLQQTQTDRVVPYYKKFLERFPNVSVLANAKAGEVVRLWQGLGYNRRALYLHQCAHIIVSKFGGQVPLERDALLSFPGVGEYTADAVRVFAGNISCALIETNIRTVYLKHFFPKGKNISDKNILEVIGKTLDMKNSRQWYQALMDYGAFLKRETGERNVRSRHYVKQKPFRGSQRELRGALLRLASSAPLTRRTLSSFAVVRKISHGTVHDVLEKLTAEGFLQKKRDTFNLP